MKKIIAILLLFGSANAQDIAKWTPTGAKIDSVQQKTAGGKWVTIQTVFGGINTAIIPGPVYYYRVKGSNGITTNSVLVYKLTPILMSNFSIVNHVLSWRSQNETNILYYSIQESSDGVNFRETERVPAKGGGIYQTMIP